MTLMNLTAGKCVSQAIAVAAELGIPDLLKDRPGAAAEIARTASASNDGVYRLLRALGSVGLFAEAGNRKFRLTPLGRLLRRDSSQTLGGYARFVGDQSTWRPWGELRHSVRTGEPAFDRVFAMPIFEYFAKMPESAAVFDAAMTSISTWESKAVVAGYEFPGSTLWWTLRADTASCSQPFLKRKEKCAGSCSTSARDRWGLRIARERGRGPSLRNC